MNRQQRRAATKGDSRARARRMGQRGYDMARHRASRWLVGACYEGVPVIEERDGEVVHGLTGHWRFPPTVPASRWNAVADYAAGSPQRWRIEVSAVFCDERGDEYIESVEIETGQALLLSELTDTWRGMLNEALSRGNSRHHSHDVVRAWPMMGRLS
ncbi:hypothetical protein [uncultured Halomonas sp.]|uniref:hypothetical protein n=1 Tax=uncultured Halomonas sp. TaxID=173971 RepID=UPI0026178E1C|nr:hypothetical protein [uncultured Halomonas sp.]